jgi:hypothetical protein
MKLNIDIVRESWGWVGLEPAEIVGENDFGNLLIKDTVGKYWRLCPEECFCNIVAENHAAFEALLRDEAFLQDWRMHKLIALARDRLGPLPKDRKYCLKIPGIWGGAYDGNSLATITLAELLAASGYIASQIKDLPDGAQVQLRIVD